VFEQFSGEVINPKVLLFFCVVLLDAEFFEFSEDLIIDIDEFGLAVALLEAEGFDVVIEEFVEFVLCEGAVEVVEVGVLLEVVEADPVEDMVDLVGLDVPLQDVDEGLAPLPVDNHQADHCVYYLVQELETVIFGISLYQLGLPV
jgi:hypothetical protein